MSTTRIASAANVIVPAYLSLRQKGYSVSRAKRPAGEAWTAEKDGNTFTADDPVALLGIVCLFETRGENWNASDREIEEFLDTYARD